MIACKGRYRLPPPTGIDTRKGSQIMELGHEGVALEPYHIVSEKPSRKIPTRTNETTTHKNVKAPGFWDVMPSRIQSKPAWMKFGDAWVEEVRRGLMACIRPNDQ
jgi:hypothetical protein